MFHNKSSYTMSKCFACMLMSFPHTVAHQGSRVCGHVVVQAPHQAGQTKVRHLAHQVGINQHVACRQVAVYKVSLRQVTHSCTNPSQHPHQLKHTELVLILLQE